MSMVVVKKCNMRQSGNVKKMCLFFLALGIQFGYLLGQSADGDLKVKFESIEFVENVDLLEDVNDEKVMSNGIVVNKQNKHHLIIAMAASKGGCIYSLPINALTRSGSTETHVAGKCETDNSRKKRAAGFTDGPTDLDDGTPATLTLPENLNSLSNGDILFTDNRVCVRRVRDKSVLTIFGDCDGFTLDLSYTYPIRSFLYIEEKLLMVFAVDNEGILVSGPGMRTRKILAFEDVHGISAFPTKTYNLAQGEGSIVWHKVNNGFNTYNFTAVYGSQGELTFGADGNGERVMSYSDDGNKVDTSATFSDTVSSAILTESHGMSVNPHFKEIVLISEGVLDGDSQHLYTANLKTGQRESACLPGDGDGAGESWCVIDDTVSPVWVADDLALAYSNEKDTFVILHYDIDRDDCRRKPCVNGGTCHEEYKNYTCECPQWFTGKHCAEEVWECTNMTCNGHGTCYDKVGRGTACQCDIGWDGYTCNKNIDDCVKDPCGNGGTCLDGDNNYTCACTDAWTGRFCEDDIPECNETSCANNGTCKEIIGGGIKCFCPRGFNGPECETNIDDCDPNPCIHGGECIDGVGKFTCECPDDSPWTGELCHEDIPECVSDTCSNNGQCREKLGGGTICQCDAGWTSSDCSVMIDLCNPNPCAHKGNCSSSPGSMSCLCRDGFTGKYCTDDIPECTNDTCAVPDLCKEIVGGGTICLCPRGLEGARCETDVNECDRSPCRNNGNCTEVKEKLNEFTCTCEAQWKGKTCSQHSSLCAADTCSGNGRCIDDAKGLPLCLCYGGFKGADCSIAKDDCVPNPCAQGATCEDGHMKFTCHCPSHRQGITCGEDIPECEADTCVHGQCREKQDGGTICICDPGYAGEDCFDDIDECSSQPCFNGGTCKDLVNGFSCQCPPEFTGISCALDVIDCDCDSCNGNGECKEKVGGGFICKCKNGWRGETCNLNRNDCKPNPCANGAVCEDLVADYQCVCPAGWTGKQCNDDIPECTEETCGGHGDCKEKRGGGVFCKCDKGYAGPDCTTNIDDCRRQPCANGGECVDGVASFECKCLPNFTGETCNEKIR